MSSDEPPVQPGPACKLLQERRFSGVFSFFLLFVLMKEMPQGVGLPGGAGCGLRQQSDGAEPDFVVGSYLPLHWGPAMGSRHSEVQRVTLQRKDLWHICDKCCGSVRRSASSVGCPGRLHGGGDTGSGTWGG